MGTSDATKGSSRSIPAGLARAIHDKLGPGPIGMGTAPVVSAFAATANGWTVTASSQSLTGQVSRAGRTTVRLRGDVPVSLQAATLTAGSSHLALEATSAAMGDNRLAQSLGAVQSEVQLTQGGIEQRFTITRPVSRTATTVTLGFASPDSWRIVDAGAAVESPGSHLVYGGLRTIDATGRVLPSQFVLGHGGPQIAVDTEGASYPITIDPTWANASAPLSTLLTSAGAGDTKFGYSVALSSDGTTALVGASENGTGAVFVYHVTAAKDWATVALPSATLTVSSSDPVDPSELGYSVAISADGTTALIGAPGGSAGSAAFIYRATSESSWATTSQPYATVLDGTGATDGFGQSVALSANGRTALIGAPIGQNSGGYEPGDAYVYDVASETDWASTATPAATLTDPSADVYSGCGSSVSLSATGTTALVGCDSNGQAYIFQVSSAVAWAGQPKPKSNLNDGSAYGDFAGAVALSGDGTTALIGAPEAEVSNGYGAAYVFVASTKDVWPASPAPAAILTDSSSAGAFGRAVALSTAGTTALVGDDDADSDVGAADVFVASSEQAWAANPSPSPAAVLTQAGGGTGADFGTALALAPDGETALVAALGVAFGDDGVVQVYRSGSSSSWSSTTTPQASITDAGNPETGSVGYAVSLSADGTTALVGYSSGVGSDGYAIPTVYVFHASSEKAWSSTATSVATLTNAVDNDYLYGDSVTISADGTTAFVGDIGLNDNSGAVYVYHVASENKWSSAAPLVATLSDASSSGNSFGWGIAVSTDGTTALIGNGLFNSDDDTCALGVAGDAFIFSVASESHWVSKSTPTATISDAGTKGDCFGSAVALSADGTTALVGAYGAGSGAGAAFIYRSTSESAWKSTSKPAATLSDSAATWFGWSLALSSDGTTALIGAPETAVDDLDDTGVAFVFHASSAGAWSSSSSPTAELSDAALSYYTLFGWSVALSAAGTTALIDGNGSAVQGGAGSAYVYGASAEDAWASSTTPPSTLSDSVGPGDFAWAVSISADGTTALVGDFSGGAGYIYQNVAPVITTQPGAGAMTASPASVVAGSTDNTVTFTYTASGGALDDGAIDVAVPAGWTPATFGGEDGPEPGFTYSTCGSAASGASGDYGEVIEVTGVTLASGAICTITYGYPEVGYDTTAAAPSSPTTSTFTTSTAPTATADLADISTSPVVAVKKSGQVLTDKPTVYKTLAESGSYNVGVTTNDTDTDPGPVITYSISQMALDSAGCSISATGVVTFARAGTCTAAAVAGPTANFTNAAQVLQVINVYKVLPTITIKFNSDGGSAVKAMSGTIGTSITLPKAPKYTGYVFDGWAPQPPDEGYYDPVTSPYTLTESLTLYAEWTPALYTITFNSEGGSSVPSFEGYYESTFDLPAAPTYTGYVFDGWFTAPTGGVALTSPYTILASATLYAQWTASG